MVRIRRQSQVLTHTLALTARLRRAVGPAAELRCTTAVPALKELLRPAKAPLREGAERICTQTQRSERTIQSSSVES